MHILKTKKITTNL